MGSVISLIVSENPNSSNPTLIPSVPKSPETDQSSVPKSPETDESTEPGKQESEEDNRKAAEEEEEEEEKGECAFCVFMKGGECRDAFTNWENCIKEAEIENKGVVRKCFDETWSLMKCLKAHPGYYEPVLRAEKESEKEHTRNQEQI